MTLLLHYATVFTTGAAVMIVEILGTRVIAPVFGVNLFVWAALLAVTLASLGIGYFIGGVLVDRTPKQWLLALVIMAAGVLVGVVPAVSRAVLSVCAGLGPRFGPLASSAILFSWCLCALGMVGPIAVRLDTRDLKATGYRVGSTYAVSTAGSLLATLLTAFVFIPAFPTKNIFLGTSFLLLVVGTLALSGRHRSGAIATFFIPLLASLLARGDLPNGITILDTSQSLYGRLDVIEDKNRGIRLLRADHSIIGGEYTRDRAPCFAFVSVLESVRFLRPDAREVLQVGLGTGSLPSVLRPFGIRVDVVEIDPEVVRIARTYFGFSAQAGDVYVEDARTFLQRTARRYDIVVHDTFTGGSSPEHLLSLEVLKQIKAILRPGGLLALNFAGYPEGPNAEASWAVARTLRATFSTVRVFRDSAPSVRPGEASNQIYFASDSPIDFGQVKTAHPANRVSARTLRDFTDWEVLRHVPDGPVITDDMNPLARLQLPTSEEHFNDMNTLLPLEVWVH